MNKLNNYSTLPGFINEKLNGYLNDLIYSNNNKHHLVMGALPGEHDLILQSNDYLDLANNQTIINHHINAIRSRKNSPFMSGIFLQNEQSKPKVEQKLAHYTGFKSCLLSQSGWAANMALLQTICDTSTQVYVDFFAHMSLWQGATVAGSDVHPFMHNNVKHLEKLIKRHGPGVVLIDSIYSTIGTVAPIAEIIAVAKENGCAIVVDESHSLGTHGQKGRGLLHELNLSHLVDFMTASLAKTFAYRAGAIWCNNQADQCIPFVAYPAIFSSAMLPHELDRLDKTLEVIKQSDDKRQRLADISRYIKSELVSSGITVRSDSQIIALETGDERNTENVRDYLEASGIFGAVFCRPATTRNKNIIRFSINSAMQDSEIEKLISVCRSAQHQPDLYIL
ncbi:alpha-hydroxyketone-type quorum-sensing autoinducer synthase [Vibrio sinaloensis]|uniref:alpha-hydroxyketone-type quorum-sensing autoinducer synthase n=1 Tax=Photobacterium sp. (strain ATCC 43367) TaxID=379097 RepID=UPI00204A785E|nr:alpha-hydroxyketone-type quorum-sensing autoinducer synthase [Vibrio sinaloensis]UPQ89970.1 quorum-sensing autoinducer CAI-1 synthase [Vibrio sinaloensis]